MSVHGSRISKQAHYLNGDEEREMEGGRDRIDEQIDLFKLLMEREKERGRDGERRRERRSVGPINRQRAARIFTAYIMITDANLLHLRPALETICPFAPRSEEGKEEINREIDRWTLI